MCESVFKVLVVGDSGVGKTAMVARYCHSKWLANYKATLGGENYDHTDTRFPDFVGFVSTSWC